MKSIALPERKILLPRLEFPAWLRFPRGVSDERAARMLAPLGGMLTPLGVSGVAAESLLLDTVTGAYGAVTTLTEGDAEVIADVTRAVS